jgi:photosystem II stability/assembly factor-like uncharacterized protein
VTGTPAPGAGGANLNGVSCPTAVACVAVGYRPGATPAPLILATTDSGHRWRRQTIGTGGSLGPNATGTLSLGDVSCADTRHCMAVGAVTAPLPGGAVVVTTNGGRAWTAALGPPGDNALVGVHCSAPRTCTVLAVSGATTFSATTTDDGATWQHGGALPPGFAGASALSCPTALTCAVAGYTATSPGHGAGAVAVTHDGGTTWSAATVPPTGVLHAVSCGSSNCLAVGTSSTVTTGVAPGAGALLASGDGGVTFTARPASAALDDAFGVGCAPATGRTPTAVCAAVGIRFTHAIPPVPRAVVAATVDPGGPVAALTTRYVPSPLVAITCPAAGRCVAVGGDELASVTLPAAATLHRAPQHRGSAPPAHGHSTTTTG